MGWLRNGYVVGLALLSGCAAEPEPVGVQPEPQPAEVRAPLPSDGLLLSDRDTYTATCQGEGYEKICTFTLVMTYTNQTDATVYFNHCDVDSTYPIYFISGLTREESAYAGAWGCTGHDRLLKVEPGEARVDTLTLSGPNAWDGVTGAPFGVLEGRLQILYETYSCAGEAEPCGLPRETATSNVFTVTLPE